MDHRLKPHSTMALAACLLVLQGCSRRLAESAAPAAADASADTVELSLQQQRAVKVQPAASYRFALRTRALGTIAFDEDLAIVQAESTLLAAAATDQLTGKELERVRSLAGAEGGIAVKELEQTASDQQAARGALQAARAALRALGESDTDIDRIVTSGKTEAVPDSGKWAVGFVPESDSAALKVGEAVEVTVTVYPDQSFHGRVSRVYPVLDADTHRARFRARLSDPANRLRPGMLADITVQRTPLTAEVTVPAAAVVREGDGTTTVWVTTDGRRFIRRTATIGLQQDDRVQIVNGLSAGERVAADGALFLSDLLQSPPTD
jgi:cobalt-zinc-cadmium efflux system membrane fusion protein